MERKRTQLICQYCNKPFYSKGGHLSQKTCSKECGYKLRALQGSPKKDKKYSHLQRARLGICVVCGCEFRAIKDFINKKNGYIRKQKYCSKECWNKRAAINKNCLYCGKQIKTSLSVNKNYCNEDCRNKDYVDRFSGEKSHLWKGGLTKESQRLRTSAEYKNWRKEVFKRDNFTCQECNIKRSKDEEIILNAHHINHWADCPELRFDINNGITLCKKCHQSKHPNILLK